jgi:hypothetical protein
VVANQYQAESSTSAASEVARQHLVDGSQQRRAIAAGVALRATFHLSPLR